MDDIKENIQPTMGPGLSPDTPNQNTDTEIFREVPDDYCSPSMFATKDGKIGIDVGGIVIIKSLRDWHALHAQEQKDKEEHLSDLEKIKLMIEEGYLDDEAHSTIKDMIYNLKDK